MSKSAIIRDVRRLIGFLLVTHLLVSPQRGCQDVRAAILKRPFGDVLHPSEGLLLGGEVRHIGSSGQIAMTAES